MAKNDQREYRIWKNMKSRCYSPCLNKIRDYQSKGIIVCDRWKDSYENFLEDMGKCPENYSIERKDNNGNYEPTNCIWADSSVQSKNRGEFNILITYNNETKVLKDWARFYGIKYITLYQRMFTQKLSFEEAINAESHIRTLTYKGETLTIRQWSEKLGIKYSILLDRCNRNWETSKIFEKPIRKTK